MTNEMTLQEYRAKQMELRTLINHYRAQSCEMQSQIALNEREIVKLDQQLTELHEQFLKQSDIEEGVA